MALGDLVLDQNSLWLSLLRFLCHPHPHPAPPVRECALAGKIGESWGRQMRFLASVRFQPDLKGTSVYGDGEKCKSSW